MISSIKQSQERKYYYDSTSRKKQDKDKTNKDKTDSASKGKSDDNVRHDPTPSRSARASSPPPSQTPKDTQKSTASRPAASATQSSQRVNSTKVPTAVNAPPPIPPRPECPPSSSSRNGHGQPPAKAHKHCRTFGCIECTMLTPTRANVAPPAPPTRKPVPILLASPVHANGHGHNTQASVRSSQPHVQFPAHPAHLIHQYPQAPAMHAHAYTQYNMNARPSNGYPQHQQVVHPQLQTWGSMGRVPSVPTHAYFNPHLCNNVHFPMDAEARAIVKAEADANAIYNHARCASQFTSSIFAGAGKEGRPPRSEELARAGAALKRARSIVNLAEAEGRLQAFGAFGEAKVILRNAEAELANKKLDRRVLEYRKKKEREEQEERERVREEERKEEEKKEKKELKKAKSFKDIKLSRQLSKQFGTLWRRKSMSDSKEK